MQESHEVKSLREKVTDTDKKLDEVLFYLRNDPHTGRRGLVQEVRDNELEIGEVKKKLMPTSSSSGLTTHLRRARTLCGAWLAGLFVQYF